MKLKEILEEFSSTRAYLVVFRRYMLFMLRAWFLCKFRLCYVIEVVRCDDRRMVFIFNWMILIGLDLIDWSGSTGEFVRESGMV